MTIERRAGEGTMAQSAINTHSSDNTLFSVAPWHTEINGVREK